MIQVCYYKGCGIVYGEKEPLSDKRKTHGLCPTHREIYLRELEAEMEKLKEMTEKLHVLLVEDSRIFRELFKSMLADQFPSMAIEEAENGEEALKKVETFRPHLIFMDIRLPGESGLELTRKIKDAHPDIIVIILTSYDIPEYQETAKQNKADYFFVKGASTAKNIFSLVESILQPHA
jgi:CheY-like chemotaxis protein